MAAVVLVAGACSSPGPATAGSVKAVLPPGTPAGAQFRWLLAAVAHLPISGAQVRAHFDAAFLAQISPAMLNQGLQAAPGVKLLSIQVSEPDTLIALVSTSGVLPRAQAALTVDGQGLISRLRISPASTAPAPATWAGVDAAVRFRSASPDSSTTGPDSQSSPRRTGGPPARAAGLVPP